MRSALVAEYRKLITTRLWWILLVVMAAYLAFIAAVIAFSVTATTDTAFGAGIEPARGVDAATAVFSLVNSIGYVFPLVIGSLAVTTEFRHQTITQSLLVEPRRGVLLTAKLIATVPIGLVYGVVAVLAVVLGGAPILAIQGDGAFLANGEILTLLGLGVLVIAIWAVIGAAFGSMVTNQVAAIVIILAFTQFVEPIARIGLAAVDGLSGVSAFLPGAAADAVIGASFFSSMGATDLLSRGGGAAVLLGYVVVFATIGRVTTLRRDIT